MTPFLRHILFQLSLRNQTRMVATCKMLIVRIFIVMKGNERDIYGLVSHSVTVQFKGSSSH